MHRASLALGCFVLIAPACRSHNAPPPFSLYDQSVAADPAGFDGSAALIVDLMVKRMRQQPRAAHLAKLVVAVDPDSAWWMGDIATYRFEWRPVDDTTLTEAASVFHLRRVDGDWLMRCRRVVPRPNSPAVFAFDQCT